MVEAKKALCIPQFWYGQSADLVLSQHPEVDVAEIAPLQEEVRAVRVPGTCPSPTLQNGNNINKFVVRDEDL